MKTWRETAAVQASVAKSMAEKGNNPKKPKLDEKTFSKRVDNAVASAIAAKEKDTEEDYQFTKLRDALISAATASKIKPQASVSASVSDPVTNVLKSIMRGKTK